MSFQRSLTGESTMVATVNLNTNISANSVSTVNLSATNASFTNISTNTWTAGNVSTPNIIATNAYISNLNVCIFNVCSITASNASFTNVSIASHLTVPNISFLRHMYSSTVMTVYTSGGVSFRDINESGVARVTLNYNSTQFIETYGTIFEAGKSGNKGYSRITAGENFSFQIYADDVKQLENTSTAGWTFYTSINTSRANICNLSTSSITASGITTGDINTSSVNASTISISSLNVCNMYAYSIADVVEITSGQNICILSNALVIRDVANASTEVLFNYDDATFTETNGMKFTVGQSGVNVSIKNTLPLTIFSGSVSQMTNASNIGFSFFRPIYSSNIYSSNASIKRIDCNTELRYASAYGDFLNADAGEIYSISSYIGNISKLTGVSAVYTCIYCSNLSVSNLSAINFETYNFSVGNDLDVVDSINSFRMFTSELNVSNIDVYNRIDAQRVVLTAALDAPISNVSDSRVTRIRGVSASFTSIYVSDLNASTITIPSIITTNFSVSNLSASYLTSTSTFFLDCYATNIVTTGIVSTSYFSSKDANISKLYSYNLSSTNTSLGTVTVGDRLYYKMGSGGALNYENFADNGVGGAVYYNTLDATTARHRFQYVGNDLLSINSSQIIAYKPLYCSETIYASSVSVSNASIANLSVDTLSSTTFNPANISTGNLSVTTAMTAVSATIPRLNSTSTFVTNLSASDASVTNRITVSNISTTSISATGRINADNIRTTELIAVGNVSGQAVYGNSLNTSTVNCSVTVNTSTVSCRSISSASTYTSWVNASGVSTPNISITTLTGTTISTSTGNFSNLNASALALTNISLTNMSVSGTATIVTISTSVLNASALNLLQGNSTTYGQIQQIGTSVLINTVSPQANAFLFQTNATNRLDIGANGMRSYVSFFVSRGNFSVLSVSTFNPGTVTTTLVNASNGYFSALYASTWVLPDTIDVSTGNFSTINVSNFTPATVTTTTVNTSNLYVSYGYASSMTASTFFGNMSNVNSINSAGPVVFNNDAIYINNAYASVGGIPYLQMNYWNTGIGGTDQGFTMYADEVRGSVMDGGNIPFTIRSSDIVQSTTTSTAGWKFYNVINTSYQNNFSKLAVSNLSVSSLGVSTLTSTLSSAFQTNFSNMAVSNLSVSTLRATDITGSGIGVSTLSVSTAAASILTVNSQLTTPNTINCVSTALPLTLHSTTINSTSTGVRLPNYIDAIDTGTGMTIGYNQAGGFINCCRSTRFYGNVLTDGNVNTITDTATLGIGQNITTGNINIGTTTMTGNVCINTSGDCVFTCDRRSTWNTSDLIKCSTQIGSFYRNFAVINQTKTTSGQSFLFGPNNSNTSLTPVPLGLYLVSGNTFIRTNAGYNSDLSGFNVGTIVQNAYNFTTGGTRQFHATLATINTSGTTNYIQSLSFTGLVNITTTGQYIGVFSSITAVQAATVGSIYHELSQATVVKIA